MGYQPVRGYDVFPDGSFVISVPQERTQPDPRRDSEFQVILNFFEVLKERLGGGV